MRQRGFRSNATRSSGIVNGGPHGEFVDLSAVVLVDAVYVPLTANAPEKFAARLNEYIFRRTTQKGVGFVPAANADSIDLGWSSWGAVSPIKCVDPHRAL